MVAARTTEGSQRVTITKTTSATRPEAARSLAPMPKGATRIHHAPRKRATLLPETATKWVSPDRRSASRSASGSKVVSPMRNPARSAVPGVAREPPRPACTRARSALPRRIMPPADSTTSRVSAVKLPAMGARRTVPGSRRSSPRPRTRSPAATEPGSPTTAIGGPLHRTALPPLAVHTAGRNTRRDRSPKGSGSVAALPTISPGP